VRSSGGALTAPTQDQTVTGTQAAAQEQTTSQDSVPAVTPTEEQKPASTTAATPDGAVEGSSVGDDAVASASTAADVAARRPKRVVVPKISEIPSLTTSMSVTEDQTVLGSAALAPDTVEGAAVDVKKMAAQPTTDEPQDEGSTKQRAQTFTEVLAAALAPLVAPLPGAPVDQPALWAVFAWTRRQFERDSFDQRPEFFANPLQTEMVYGDVGADAPSATVDRIDRVTGRVTGRVKIADLSDDPQDGPTYSLVAPIDKRLGVVTVNGTTGQWAFTPNQITRLAAQLSKDGGVVTFSVAASNGRTADVRAPVDPAEAVVTDTIKVGDGLTYGLAVVGDRLYVLNGSSDAAGNGSVKVIDTTTKTKIGSIEVGSMPFALAARGRSLYVGNADDGTVSVVDAASNKVVDVIDVGANPYGLEIAGDRLYVADHAGTVSVIDLNDNTEVARIAIDGDPFGVAATADRVYVTDYAGGTVAVVDQATNTAADSLDLGGYPYFAAVVGSRMYVVNSATNALTIVDKTVTTLVDVDPTTRAIDAIPTDAAPVDVVVRGDRLYVSNVNCGTVAVVDVATNQPVESIGVGIQPGLMAATRDGRTIYVADVMGGTVRVITSVRHAADG
jgi:YVTN family beta-propeller protein